MARRYRLASPQAEATTINREEPSSYALVPSPASQLDVAEAGGLHQPDDLAGGVHAVVHPRVLDDAVPIVRHPLGAVCCFQHQRPSGSTHQDGTGSTP
jgi:hypothetical protein